MHIKATELICVPIGSVTRSKSREYGIQPLEGESVGCLDRTRDSFVVLDVSSHDFLEVALLFVQFCHDELIDHDTTRKARHSTLSQLAELKIEKEKYNLVAKLLEHTAAHLVDINTAGDFTRLRENSSVSTVYSSTISQSIFCSHSGSIYLVAQPDSGIVSAVSYDSPICSREVPESRSVTLTHPKLLSAPQ